jgi:hypothetical protein
VEEWNDQPVQEAANRNSLGVSPYPLPALGVGYSLPIMKSLQLLTGEDLAKIKWYKFPKIHPKHCIYWV